MSRPGAVCLGVVVLSGCAYYNTLYNSEHLYDEAEALRGSGQDSLADARYEDVVRKTSDAYRGRPTGEDVAQTLFLLGRAELRLGRAREARAALLEASSHARVPGLRPRILVHAAYASERLGDRDEAFSLLEQGLAEGLEGRELGEAYLLRGRLRLGEANERDGWADLAAAATTHPSVAADAGVERLRWGVRYADLDRARAAMTDLLRDGAAGEHLDTIAPLVSEAAARWSPSVAAAMLEGVESAPWSRPERSRLELQRATLLRSAGDTTAAEEEAWSVARGRGEAVSEARLLLARWRLGATRDLGGAQSVVPILLPVADDPAAEQLLAAIDAVEAYSGVGLDEPLGWFAAAEVARDRLAAPVLARGLFLAYADTDPSDPWAPKALLAALNMSTDDEDRSWLRGRLEAHRDSPYVQAARGGPAAGFDDLEEDLRVRLSEIATR